jgi:hypothetical protein
MKIVVNVNNIVVVKDKLIPLQADPGPDIKLIYSKSGSLPAHAHRHVRHRKIVVSQMNCIHEFCVYFIISRFSGIRFWHRFPSVKGLVARVSPSLISPPFLIKSNTLKGKNI